MEKKPNCYKCKWRGEVIGSVHSCCEHISFKKILDDPMMKIFSILGSVSGGLPPMSIEGGIKVKGNEHGIDSGWFNHPMNFDPVWLEECDGFEEKI